MGRATGRRSRLVALVALGLAGCGRDARGVADGIACYPEDARRWLAAAPVDGASKDRAGGYSVYVDGSASMAGYLRGGTADERPLADLIGMLPQLPGIGSPDAELVRFDRRVAVVAPDAMRRLQRPEGYSCPSAGGCDSQESHLDQALGRVAGADPGRLSVIVSDLWLTNSEVLTTGGVALSRPLADILSSGRGVAVYGFESPYSGIVYDLPSGMRGASASRRYLFVVAVGPSARLDALHEAMSRAPSARIAEDLADGRAHYALFTTDPMRTEASGTQTFVAPARGPLTRSAFLPVRRGVRVPQFALDRAAALRGGVGGEAVWSGVSPAEMRPGAVWTGPTRGSTRAYRMTGSTCEPAAGDWRAEGESTEGWKGASYALRPTELATLPHGSYLLVGRLRRVGLETPNPATEWMRRWSFDASTERSALASRTVPTLNLAETARLMENALAQAAERKPTDVGGFAAGLQIK